MSTQEQDASAIELPSLPVHHADWISYVASRPDTSMHELIAPYKDYDSNMRKVFAQQPNHPAIQKSNVVPLYTGSEQQVKIRARNLAMESKDEKQRYLMPLKNADRKPDGSPAIAESLKAFQTNFQLFSESSLVDMDWSNVVVAGSAVVTSLLPVPAEYNTSKRALREYYHQKLAPASDVDLFLYGLTEEQAVEKIKQIEQRIKDSILTETTTVRTKNAITIASQYPTRHVQIVLRIYRSISEILTGFDVDCSCAAYDGSQVYASPRAVAAYMTQINTIDLTRRSPSYENRLSKYSRRGFEVYWPLLDRSRIDPTLFERSFGRTLGLARLLVLEKLPNNADREAYVDQRRAERGRPAINRWGSRKLKGNMKEEHDDDVAEWVETDEVSDYHTFTIPYGPKYHARKIERLLYAKDLLLNAEWNRPKERETALHRHPAFFGNAADVLSDCCGYCPEPATPEDQEIADQEAKIYVSGDLTFIKDDPGRQAIGSFNPLTDDDWTEMAYVGNTARLCQAIVHNDVEDVRDWLSQEGADPNTRDYTGRTPLHLAVTSSTPEIVQCLIDAGARIVARLVDGKTALHLAAMRGEAAMVTALLNKSEANEEIEADKEALRKAARRAAEKQDSKMLDVTTSQLESTNIESDTADSEDDDISMVDDESENIDATTENSIVKVDHKPTQEHEHLPDDTDKDDPDVYDVNVLAWDAPVSPLHLAIANGHTEVAKVLVQDFGADVLLPIKLLNSYNKSPRAAILPLVLALQLPPEKAEEMTKVLISLGASPAQADMDHITALQYFAAHGSDVLKAMIAADRPAAQRAANHLSMSGYQYNPSVQSVLQRAIQSGDSDGVDTLLELGVKPEVDFATYITSFKTRWDPTGDSEHNQQLFRQNFQQPILTAIERELPGIVLKLLDAGADVNTLSSSAWKALKNANHYETHVYSLLDIVREKMKGLRSFLETGKVENNGFNYGYHFGMFGSNRAQSVAPVPLKDDEEYLKDLEPGSYSHWTTVKQLEAVKSKYHKDLELHEEWTKNQKEPEGTEEKQAAVKALLADFENLESKLLERDAKTFKELHPDVKLQEQQSYNHYRPHEPEPPKPWSPGLTFRLPDLTDERRAAYLKLFEACWNADITTVKELCLAVWADDQSPLQIAVQDSCNFSPFSIAVLRKHVDLARAVLEIAHAQYAPEEKQAQAKYSVRPTDEGEDSSDDEGDDEEIKIYAEIIDDRFTLENIGEVQSKVKSKVTPLEVLSWSCPVSRFISTEDTFEISISGNPIPGTWNRYGGYGRQSLRSAGRSPHQVIKHARNMRTYKVQSNTGPEYIQDVVKPENLVQLAIFQDDPELLHFLIAMGEDYSRPIGDNVSEADTTHFRFEEQDFLYAIRLGRVQLLEEIIKRTGVGIPLDDLVKKSGVQVAETPKYYQGLSVHGKKRADWANAGRDQTAASQEQHPPLLHAARLGSLESVEWFLGDAPLRCYNEFADSHRDDVRIQNLAKAKGGIEASISNWLNLRSNLLFHCVILGKTDENSLQLLRHLCKIAPESVQQKPAKGVTPLQLAFSLHRVEMIKILLEAGADQTCRNQNGENIVHSLINNTSGPIDERIEITRSLLNLIDIRLLPSLFNERTSNDPGAATPLARWIFTNAQHISGYNNYNPSSPNTNTNLDAILKVLLEFSKGEDLHVINGEGDTPLHAAVRYGADTILRVMLDCRPDLLFRENATGRTPYEMAGDAYLSKQVFENPPSLTDQFGNRRHGHSSMSQQQIRLLDRQSQTFVEKGKDLRSGTERVWELCKEFEQKARGTKRKLVSLVEASEVARRLAARKSNQNRRRGWRSAQEEQDGDNEEDEETKGNEVSAWYSMALQADLSL